MYNKRKKQGTGQTVGLVLECIPCFFLSFVVLMHNKTVFPTVFLGILFYRLNIIYERSIV